MKSNRGNIQRYGQNAFLMRVKLMKVNENQHYTGFFTWAKKYCGVNFIEKLGDGTVTVDLLDKAATYKIVSKFTGQESKHYNTVFQFENTAAECDNCLGSSQQDQLDMMVSNLDTVEWGNKDPATCLATLRAGYLGEYQKAEYTTDDVTPCVSWTQKFW